MSTRPYTQPRWIAGVVVMIAGQFLNLAALPFLPQSVVSVLGGLAIVFNAAFAHAMLGEHLRKREVMLMMAMILGATLVVTETPVPKEEELYVDHIFGAKNKPFIFTALTVVVMLASLGALCTVFPSLKLFLFGLTSAACGSYAMTFVKCCAQIMGSEDRWSQDLMVYLLAFGALSIFVLQIAAMQGGLIGTDAVVSIPVFFALGVLFTIFQAQFAFGELNELHGEPQRMLFISGVLLVIVTTIALQRLHPEGKDERLPLLVGSAQRKSPEKHGGAEPP